jgi:hypothetical protein
MMPRAVPRGRKVVVLYGSYSRAACASADALAAYLREAQGGGVDVALLDVLEHFAPGAAVLARFAQQQSTDFFPSSHGDIAALSASCPHSVLLNELTERVLGGLRAYLETDWPMAVLSTCSVAAAAVAEVAEPGLILGHVLTGFDASREWIHPRTDVIFAAAPQTRDDLVLKGVAWDRIACTGIPVAQQWTEVAQMPSAAVSASSRGDRFSVLIYPSSSSDGVELASSLSGMGIRAFIVVANGSRAERRLSGQLDSEGSVRIVTDSRALREAVRSVGMAAGDAALLPVEGCLAAGLPLILYNQVPAADVGSVDFMVNWGALITSRDEVDALARIRFFSQHRSRLDQMADAARTLGRPEAVRTVCERMLAAT